MKKWRILIPILITTNVPLVSLVACNNQENETIDFNTCEWNEISVACNKLEEKELTEEQFCKMFSFGNIHPKKLDDFVGQERIVKINGVNHRVAIVGVQQDYMNYDESNGFSNPVVFTFKFQNLISNRDGSYLKIQWERDTVGHNRSYWDSYLENALDSSVSQLPVQWITKDDGVVPPDDRISVYNLINRENNDIDIKDVYRGVNTQPLSESWSTTRQKTKVFCLTLANVFSQKGINSSPLIETPQEKLLYCNEGEQYAFYKQEGNIADAVLDYATEHDCLICRDCSGQVEKNEGEANYYWFASPYVSSGDFNLAWIFGFLPLIGYAPVMGFDNISNTDCSIAPCFCI